MKLSMRDLLKIEENSWIIYKCRIVSFKGRFQNAELDQYRRSLIYISKDSVLTQLIINDAHKKVKHSGVKDILTELRAIFWVPQGRKTIKKVILKMLYL